LAAFNLLFTSKYHKYVALFRELIKSKVYSIKIRLLVCLLSFVSELCVSDKRWIFPFTLVANLKCGCHLKSRLYRGNYPVARGWRWMWMRWVKCV